MYHSCRRHFLDIFGVSGCTLHSQLLAVLYEDQERRTLSHADKSSNEESILQAHVSRPRRESVVHSEAPIKTCGQFVGYPTKLPLLQALIARLTWCFAPG